MSLPTEFSSADDRAFLLEELPAPKSAASHVARTSEGKVITSPIRVITDSKAKPGIRRAG
jgi:hypothetical protein